MIAKTSKSTLPKYRSFFNLTARNTILVLKTMQMNQKIAEGIPITSDPAMAMNETQSWKSQISFPSSVSYNPKNPIAIVVKLFHHSSISV